MIRDGLTGQVLEDVVADSTSVLFLCGCAQFVLSFAMPPAWLGVGGLCVFNMLRQCQWLYSIA